MSGVRFRPPGVALGVNILKKTYGFLYKFDIRQPDNFDRVARHVIISIRNNKVIPSPPPPPPKKQFFCET